MAHMRLHPALCAWGASFRFDCCTRGSLLFVQVHGSYTTLHTPKEQRVYAVSMQPL